MSQIPTAKTPTIKDPQAKLDYSLDWKTNWLVAGDTIATSTWEASSTDLTLSDSSYSPTLGQTTVFVAGGTVGETYQIANTITTTGGRIDQRTIWIKIAQM